MPQVSARKLEPAAPPVHAPLRVLIVEDNRSTVESLKVILEMKGNSTFAAYDGIEGIELAEKLLPDVILLDICLPKIDGYEACRRIRQQPWGRTTLIYALTALGHDDAIAKSQNSGFDLHLVKPVEPEILLTVLEMARARHRAN